MEQAAGSDLRIRTPEAVSFTLDTAGIGARFVAAALDTIILAFMLLAVSSFFVIVYGMFQAFQGGDNLIAQAFDTLRYLMFALMFLASFGIIWGYYIFFEHVRGGVTPGKRAAGLKVIKADGSPLSFSDVAIRNLIRFVDFFPSLYIVGIISISCSRKRQRLGDLAAGTLVVHVRAPVYVGRTDQFGRPIITGQCRISLEPKEYEIAINFLLRRREFHPARRAYLCSRIASSLARKYDLPLERFPDGETMLVWLFSGEEANAAAVAPAAPMVQAP